MPILPSERTGNRYRSDKRASIATTPNQTHGGRAERGGPGGARRAADNTQQHSDSQRGSGALRRALRRAPRAAHTSRTLDRAPLYSRQYLTSSNRHHAHFDYFRVCIATYFHPLKVDWVHNGALKEFHSCKVSLEQAFELQVGRFPVMNAQLTPRAMVTGESAAWRGLTMQLYVPKYAVVWWCGVAQTPGAGDLAAP